MNNAIQDMIIYDTNLSTQYECYQISVNESLKQKTSTKYMKN